MNTIRINKKLSLNKSTIANLSNEELGKIKAGDYSLTQPCFTGDDQSCGDTCSCPTFCLPFCPTATICVTWCGDPSCP